MKNELEKFQNRLLKLEVTEFIGVAKILNVPLVNNDEEKTPLPFEEVFISMLEKYSSLSRTRQKNLQKILKGATKKKND